MDLLQTLIEAVQPHEEVLAKKTKTSNSQASAVVAMVAPMLLARLAKNASTKSGALSLKKALENHDGRVLDNIDDSINNDEVVEDGKGILRHVLGADSDKVAAKVASDSGVDSGQVMAIMTTVAPLLLGVMGREKTQMKQDDSGVMGMLGNFLDKNKDGSIVDDVLKMGMGFFRSK